MSRDCRQLYRRLRAVLADHIGMVKPEDSASEPYRYFKAAYLQLFRQSAPVIDEGLKTGLFDKRGVEARMTAAGYSREDLPQAWLYGPKPLLSVRKAWIPIEDERTVSCGDERKGKRSVPLALEVDQEVIAADVTIGGSGFDRLGIAISSIGEKEVDVAFRLVAPKRGSPRCGTSQVVWAELSYVVSRGNMAFGIFGHELFKPKSVPR